MRRLAAASALVLVLFLLVGCGRSNSNPWADPEYEHYYQGTEGVWMRFSPGTPPPRLFYYSNDPDYDNSFAISVELRNMGASDAFGALYIRGYDPHLIYIEGTELQALPPDSCFFGFGNNPGGVFGSLGLSLNCPNMALNFYDEDNIHARIYNIGEILDIPVLNYASFDLNGDDWRVNLNVDAMSTNQLDYFNHGRLLAMVLSTLDLREFYGYPFNEQGVMRGDNYFFPGGEFAFQDFNAHIVDWPMGLDQMKVDFIVDACYGYTTYAAPMICIDPKPYEYHEGDCYAREYTWSGSQGAPVAITSLKQDPTPQSIFLTFTVRNVGMGEIVHYGHLARCSPHFPGRFDDRYKDVVHIGDVRIGRQLLQCNPDYEVRLNDGIGTFTCEYRLGEGIYSAYETPVVIELWYGYHDTIRTTTLIKRAG